MRTRVQVWPWGGSREAASAGLGEQRLVRDAPVGWVTGAARQPFGSRRLSASAPRWTRGSLAGGGSHVGVLAKARCVPRGRTGRFLEAPGRAAAAHTASSPSEPGRDWLWPCVDCAGLLILARAGSARAESETGPG